jgi:hypothetical protein
VLSDRLTGRLAQTLLRHSNLSMSAAYVGVVDERRVEAIDRLDPLQLDGVTAACDRAAGLVVVATCQHSW